MKRYRGEFIRQKLAINPKRGEKNIFQFFTEFYFKSTVFRIIGKDFRTMATKEIQEIDNLVKTVFFEFKNQIMEGPGPIRSRRSHKFHEYYYSYLDESNAFWTHLDYLIANSTMDDLNDFYTRFSGRLTQLFNSMCNMIADFRKTVFSYFDLCYGFVCSIFIRIVPAESMDVDPNYGEEDMSH